MLAGVLYPLWPYTMRLGVWYLSIGVLILLGAFFGLAIFRLIFYVITLVVAKPGIWIFPRLFEDVSFVRSSFLFAVSPSNPLAPFCTDGFLDTDMGLGRSSQKEILQKHQVVLFQKGEEILRVCGKRACFGGFHRHPDQDLRWCYCRGDRRRRRIRIGMQNGWWEGGR